MNISFVYPQFLFALLLIVIPILIHLFNFRRFKKVYFTNVRFLRDIKEETTSRSKLKHLLVLLSRILAVSFLVFAFAQPFIPSPTIKKIAAERAVSIFIDNSFSMDAVTKEGSLLDVAKKKAREVVMAYKPSDRFQLLTNNFDPVNQRLVNRDEFLELVDQVKISPYSRKLKDILSRQKDALQVSGSPEKKSFILSDFQESMADLNETGTDTAIAVTLIPVQTENVSNVFVDSCWFSSPILQINQPVELNVRVRNYGNLDREAIPVKLLINGMQKVVATVSVNAGNYSDTKLTFTPSVTGWQKGEVLIDDNPITFDDQYFFSFKIAEQLNILHIFAKQKGNYLKALFGASAYFHLNETDEKQLDYSSLSNQNLIILDEVPVVSSGLSAELKKYLNNGGSLVVFPDSALDFNSFGNFLNEIGAEKFTAIESGGQQKIDKLTLEDPLFNGVFSSGNKIDESTDLPLVDKYFSQPSTSGSKRENLMVMRNGLPLLSRYRIGKGATYLFAVPLSGTFSNLSRHAIFVPVMYRIALLSERPAIPAYFIGKDDQMELSALTTSGEQVFHLVNQDKKFDVIPAHRESTGGTVIDINNQVTEAGAYDLKLNDKLVSVFAFNFNRDESVMRFNDIASLNDQISALRLKNFVTLKSDQVDITSSISTMNDGKLLWKYCIILVLLFLALETLLLKFWKQ